MKQVLSILICLTLALGLPASVASTSAPAQQELVKDETVYLDLNADGSIARILVVNRLETPLPGLYTDYGHYQQVTNLSGPEQPQLSDNKLIWDLPARSEGFYYQGLLAAGEPPFLIELTYTLNGNAVSANEIVGQAGQVELGLTITNNPLAASYFRENYLCQVQIPLNLNATTKIQAPEASTIIVGRTATLAYTVLPGKSAEHQISFDTHKFELDTITITSSWFDPASFTDIDTGQFEDGLAEMGQGVTKLTDGTEELQSGLAELAAGIKELACGSTKLAAGTAAFTDGLENYAAGAGQLHGNLQQLDTVFNQLGTEGNALSAGYYQLAGGTSQLLEELAPLLAYLTPEEQAVFSAQIDGLTAQLSGFGSQLEAYTNGVAQSAQGLTGLTLGLGEYAANGLELSAEAPGVAEGVSSLAKALAKLSSRTSPIPREVQKLIDGQRGLKRGIDEYATYLKELEFVTPAQEPISFVDAQVSPRSVQFVARTPDLKVKAVPEPTPQEADKVGFLTRLLKLFGLR